MKPLKQYLNEAYLVQNKRTGEFIDYKGEWTGIRSFARKFNSKDSAQDYADYAETRGDDPYMKVVREDSEMSKYMLRKGVVLKLPRGTGTITSISTDVDGDKVYNIRQDWDKKVVPYSNLMIISGFTNGSVKVISEATMSDIPHEIDDQIHKLKDMRFDLEETQKNWELAGLDTTPLSNVISGINELIHSMYNNGAKLADQEVVNESFRPEPKIDTSSKEAFARYENEYNKWQEELSQKFQTMSKRVGFWSDRLAYITKKPFMGVDLGAVYNDFEKIYNDLEKIMTKNHIKKDF